MRAKKRSAAARGGLWCWLALSPVGAAQGEVGHVRLSLVGDCAVAVSWSVPESSNRSELRQVHYARNTEDLAAGPSKTLAGEVSGTWQGRRWLRAVLRDLEQDYAYRIGGSGGFGPVDAHLASCSAKAAASPPSQEAASRSETGPPSVRLAVVGDLGVGDNTSEQVLARMLNSSLDTLVHLGDVAGQLSTQGGAKALDFLSQLQPLVARRPYMPLPGDRDDLGIYQRLFQMSNSSADPWYSFTIGYARFIMLRTEAIADLGTASSGWPEKASSAARQLQWLEAQLKQANEPEARAQRPWVIVAGHRPTYCSLVRPTCSAEAAALRSILEPLFVRYEVDLYLAAHVHAYERTFRTLNGSVCKTDTADAAASCGPVTIVNGEAGEPPLQYEDMPARFTVQRHPGQPGYGELTVLNATALEYRQLDALTGATSDQFLMLRSPREHEPQENFLEAVGWLAFATALVTFTCGFVKWVHSDGLKRRDEALRHLRTEIAVLSGMPLKTGGSPVEAQRLVGDGAGGGLH